MLCVIAMGLLAFIGTTTTFNYLHRVNSMIPTWTQILRRIISIWRLHRKEFSFCSMCQNPLISGQLGDHADHCGDCHEEWLKKQHGPENNVSTLRGNFQSILSPGLQSGLAQQQLAHYQQQQLQNMANDPSYLRQLGQQQQNIPGGLWSRLGAWNALGGVPGNLLGGGSALGGFLGQAHRDPQGKKFRDQ